MNTATTRIEKLRDIVENKQHGRVEGQDVDTFTASAILACHAAAGEKARGIIETAPLAKVAGIAMRMCGKDHVQ